ncbi:MAG: trypsin-like peptidase domain-containing protein [Agathobacter sp.]|nr:trypsin-like peptidase domain-containing protein [Agathobacter sp.]
MSNFGKSIGKYVATATVFGLVSGTVFTGVCYTGNKYLNNTSTPVSTESSSSSGNITTNSKSNSSSISSVSDIVDEVMPSIVAITNTSTVNYQNFMGGRQQYESESCGTGVILSQDSDYLYIATNNHVVADANSLTVQFNDETTVSAETQGTYPSNDLAVVKVKTSDIDKDTLSAIKIATIEDSDSLEVGDSCIAIGNALGYGQSVTTGVISALNRSVTTEDETTGETITNSNLIQTDAAINPGNSGGALLNSSGKVIGINSVKYASTEVEGIGYAIPLSVAKPILESLIKSGSYTNDNAAYLGIEGRDVSSDIASVYNMPLGIYVNSVVSGSGAEKAGILQGDIITKFNGKDISSTTELQSYLASCSAGDTVKVVISRQNGNGYEEQELEVTLTKASANNSSTQRSEQKRFGSK